MLQDGAVTFEAPTAADFYRDMGFLAKQITSPGPVTTYAYRRLQVLPSSYFSSYFSFLFSIAVTNSLPRKTRE